MNLQEVLSGSPASIWHTKKEPSSKQIGNKIVREKGEIEEIILGPVTSENESFSSSVTTHAIEDGLNITDHVKSNPDNFSIRTILADKNDLAASAVDAAKGLLGVKVDKLTVKDKITRLKEWKEKGKLVTYSGPRFSGILTKGYDITEKSLIITSVSTNRTKDTGAGIEVSISFQKVIIVKSEQEDIKLIPAAKKTKDVGKQEKGSNLYENKNR